MLQQMRSLIITDMSQVLNDDISNVLILNKKSIANHENQLFQAELEKFRSHQNRLVSTVHKQSSLLKDLTRTFGDLLQDKRVRSDQQKYEALQKSRNSVMSRYKRVFSAHEDLIQGLMRAQGFYSEMKESVDSLEKNVESFVNNRRAEGAQLLSQIEQTRSNANSGQASAERERLQQLMARMSMEPSPSSPNPSRSQPPPIPAQSPYRSSPISPQYPTTNPDPRFTIPPQRPPLPPSQTPQPSSSQPKSGPNGYHHQPQQPATLNTSVNHPFAQGAAAPLSTGYNPMAYPYQVQFSPPAQPNQHSQQQQYFSPSANQSPNSPSYPLPGHSQQQQQQPQPQQHTQTAPQHQQLSFTSPSPQSQQHTQPASQHHQLSFTSPSPQLQQQQWQPYIQQQQHQQQQQQHQPYGLPSGYVPPPPPPGPPGGGSQTQYPPGTGQYASGPGGYPHGGQRQQQPGGDPWAGLSAWK
jgi:hypothetical protein